jgi:DNA-binding MarR family transcriptional regulator
MTTVDPTSESARSSSEDVGIPLYRVLIRLSRLLRKKTSGGELTLTQLSTLAIAEDCGPTRLGALAARIGVAAPTLSRMIESLCERELLDRAPDPHDHRATRVVLSPSGKAVLEELRERGIGYLSTRIDILDERQLAALTAVLPVLEQLAVNESPADN